MIAFAVALAELGKETAAIVFSVMGCFAFCFAVRRYYRVTHSLLTGKFELGFIEAGSLVFGLLVALTVVVLSIIHYNEPSNE